MTCVKCPITHEWQMVKECMRCSNSDAMFHEDRGYVCEYDDNRKEDVISYAKNNLTFEELKELAIWKAELRMKPIKGVKFFYNPKEVDLDEVYDSLFELAEMGSQNEYIIHKKEGRIHFM